jgi:hypothetical protein
MYAQLEAGRPAEICARVGGRHSDWLPRTRRGPLRARASLFLYPISKLRRGDEALAVVKATEVIAGAGG